MKHTDTVREFVVRNFLYGDGYSLENDTSFLESGTVDSTGILELIMFMENTFGIKVESEEMIPENLDSVNRVANFITKKLSAPEVVRTG